jgi:hypothetical protein
MFRVENGRVKYPTARKIQSINEFVRSEIIASQSFQEQRLEICETCKYNVQGICKQCCGSVPIKTLIALNASACGRGYWKKNA